MPIRPDLSPTGTHETDAPQRQSATLWGRTDFRIGTALSDEDQGGEPARHAPRCRPNLLARHHRKARKNDNTDSLLGPVFNEHTRTPDSQSKPSEKAGLVRPRGWRPRPVAGALGGVDLCKCTDRGCAQRRCRCRPRVRCRRLGHPPRFGCAPHQVTPCEGRAVPLVRHAPQWRNPIWGIGAIPSATSLSP